MLTTRELTERIVHRHESDQAWRDAYQAIRIMLNRLQSLQEIVDNLNTPDRQGAGQFSTPYDEMYTLALQNAVKVASHRYGKDQSAAPDEVVQYIRNLGTLMFRRHRNQARYTRNVR